MYLEDDLIPLSYLSQYYYCERRAALMMLEEQWADNVHTAEGTVLHEHVHSNRSDSRRDTVILRGLQIRSLELGITGKADCIELHRCEGGARLSCMEGEWLICPVEYKHGRRRQELEYEVQLCAQAMCLEEMLGCDIPYGQLYYWAERRRVTVELDENRRRFVREGARALFEMLRTQVTPPARVGAKCRECSLREACLGGAASRSVRNYLSMLRSHAQGEDSQ
jgi:CRISPR-associated exonuclease Cas4